MKTIVGKVYEVEIGVPIKKRAGGTYEGWRLTYKTDDGEINKVEKAVTNFKYQPSLKAALESLAKGDDFTMELEKDGDFWNVTSLAKGANIPTPTPKDASPSRYKTDRTESDAARQVSIVRQSSLKAAVDAIGPGSSASKYIEMAKTFEDFVNGTYVLPEKTSKKAVKEAEVE